MDDSAIDRLFSGDLNRLIELPKRLVRLFISSTFTDMTLERNSLMERVYPRLKKYCREKHGLDFQVVDMRWGVRDEATDDHQTSTLCSREIDNCQRMSLGPNFVALLGDKYGFRPLCNRIKSTEYRALRRCLIELDINTDFLDTWYKEDLNAVPAEYLLQPISSILKNFTNKNEPDLQAVDQRIWQAIQERLHELLMIGSNRLVKQGRLSQEEQLVRYSISVTEREVIEGCLDVQEAKSQCLVFVRSIQDLQMHLNRCLASMSFTGNSPQRLDSSSSVYSVESTQGSSTQAADQRRDSQARKASLKIGDDSISLTTSLAQTSGERKVERSRKLIGKYIDLLSKDNVWRVDEEAQGALANLKEIKLQNKLGRNMGKNLIKFKILWNESDGISLKSEEHKQYLNELTDHFLNTMTRMIRKSSKNQQQLKSGLVGEILQHSHYAKHVSKTFHGRAEELEKIKAYVLSHEHQMDEASHGQLSCMPMFIYGVVGSGKTSIMAKAATLTGDWYSTRAKARAATQDPESWNQRPCIIMRFCCTTPSSSSMVGVLTSVCRQLQYNFYQYGPLNGENNLIEGQTTTMATIDSAGHQESQQLAYQPIPEDYVRLVFTFRQLLENCQHELHSQRLFLILLDSVERLSSPADSSVELKYSWLTSIVRLPPNVRLIISCSSEKTDEAWSQDYVHLKGHFLQLYFEKYREQNPDEKLFDSETKEQEIISKQADPEVENVKDDYQDDNDDRESYERIDERYRYLKRILIPTVKFKRALNKQDKEEEEEEEETRESPIGVSLASSQNRWSLTTKRLEASKPVSINNSARVLDIEPQRKKQVRNMDNVWILHIRPLGVKLAVKVLQRWLSNTGRNLTGQQWSVVETSLQHCSRPIFVKLAFGEMINWKSYSMQSDSRGLTFGSSLINDMRDNNNKSLILTGQKDFDDHLIKLMAESETGQKIAGLGFDNQILNMEQQWNNFLDYKQRKRQQQAINKVEASDNSQDASVVIRIGASSTGNASGGGSSGAGGTHTGSICHLSSTIEDAICQLFARIELQHGYILTKHSLCYITAARNGICENELEDILSLDDVVLDDVFQYHLPPVRRIPPLLWTRIRNDLPDYLSERDADGIVVNWHHGQFKQVVQNRYLSDSRQLFYIHSLLADYFLGKWAEKAKPFRCTKQQIQLAADQLESAVQQSIRDSQAFSSGANPRASISAGPGGRLPNGSTGARVTSFSVRSRLRSSDQHDARLQWMQAKADRRVPLQPLFYLDNKDTLSSSDKISNEQEKQRGSQVRRYNMRKLTELPHHLLRAGRYLDFAQHILFNYNWLSSALTATGLQNLLADFKEAIEVLSGSLRTMLSNRPEGGDPAQAAATSVDMDGISLADELDEHTLSAMISQLEVLNNTIRLSCSSIHLDTQMLAPQLIGRLLPIVRKASSLESRNDNKYLRQLLEQCDKDGCYDNALLPTDHCLQSPDGLQLSSLEGHAFAIMAMRMAADQRHLLAISNRFIMWDISTGEISRDVDPKIEASIMRQLAMGTNNDYAVAYTSDNLVLVLDILSQQVSKFDKLVSGKFSDRHSDQLIGLNLIDKVGATTFVVWSRYKWFVLKVVNNELSNPVISATSRLSVQLCCSIDMKELDDSFGQIISVQVDSNESLAFVETTCEFDDRKCVQLLTISMNFAGNGQSSCQLWAQKIVASAMAIHSDNLSQLVYADLTGNVYLSRRRKKCWSRAKLLSENSRDGRSGLSFADQLNSMLRGEYFVESRSSPAIPMAIELNSQMGTSNHASESSGRYTTKSILELSCFERVVDSLEESNEIKANAVFRPVEATQNYQKISTSINRKVVDNAVHFVRLYLSDKIVIIAISGSGCGYKTSSLLFPRNIRNISVETNRCQISSILVGQEEGCELFLVASAGRKILIYNVRNEKFLRSVDAHQARIVQLMPVFGIDKIRVDTNKVNDKRQLVFASASMDKTVKIWNLLNVDKEVHSLDKMASSVESICINQQRPLAACLARGELALWDWRRLKLITRIVPSDLITTTTSLEADNAPDEPSEGSKIVKCCFSSNGRFLLVASLSFISLVALEQSSSRSQNRGTSEGKLTFKSTFRRHLFPKASTTTGLVRRIAFFQQDSRVLTFIECNSDVRNTEGRASGAFAVSRLARRLLLLCHSVPDGRLVYTIKCFTPVMSPSAVGESVAGRRRSSASLDNSTSYSNGNSRNRERIRLPVLTLDQLHIVTVESFEQSANQTSEPQTRREGSSGLVLNVYSARDGLLVRSINLAQLEVYSASGHAPPGQPSAAAAAGSLPLMALSLQNKMGSAEQQAPRATNIQANPPPPKVQTYNAPICIEPEQFCRMKSVSYRERQSVVALLDDEKEESFLIDVKTKQLMASATAWNGKISTDGRYGLSRMFKSSSSALKAPRATGMGLIKVANSNPIRKQQQPGRDVITTAGGATTSGSDGFPAKTSANNNNGLQLLEMRHFSPVKSLLSNETLSGLSSSSLATSGLRGSVATGPTRAGAETAAGPAAAAAGNDTDVTCGFTRANDSYVYYYDSRLARLLLIRLRDGQLVANYKLSSLVTKIKCSPDGYALVLGMADGSLTSLAIVDPEKNDTLVQLAQYPSRAKLAA